MDGYKSGYQKNFDRAVNGEKREVRPPIVPSVVSDQYRQSFIQGAKDGYRQGIEEAKKKGA